MDGLMTETLHEYFGFREFRGFQSKVIRDLLNSQDCIAVMATGSGKSLCYQIPPLCMKKTAIVISPLISLMVDQVSSLTARGISALYLSGTNTQEEMRLLQSGAYSLIYMAPEKALRWLTGLRDLYDRGLLCLLAIDEAHCVSEWGYDFRTEYQQLATVRDTLPALPVVCLTATATSTVLEDISRSMKLVRFSIYRGGMNRSNLTYYYRHKSSSLEKDLDPLFVPLSCVSSNSTTVNTMRLAQAQTHSHTATVKRDVFGSVAMEGGVTVIYCLTRKEAEEVTAHLQALRWETGDERQRDTHAPTPSKAASTTVTNVNTSVGVGATNATKTFSIYNRNKVNNNTGNISSSSNSNSNSSSSSSSSSSPANTVLKDEKPELATTTTPPPTTRTPTHLNDAKSIANHPQPVRDPDTDVSFDEPLQPTVPRPTRSRTHNQLSVGVYHAGFSNEERIHTYQTLMRDGYDVLVATTAFGMGIDKRDIRRVIHYGMPAAFESYAQQTGRAGRDGGLAECLLFYGQQDMTLIKRLWTLPGTDTPLSVIDRNMKALTYMHSVCVSADCRRKSLLSYFGENTDRVVCSGCDVCDGYVTTPPTLTQRAVNVANETWVVLNVIMRCNQSLGFAKVAGLITGSQAKPLAIYRDRCKHFFGASKNFPGPQQVADYWKDLMMALRDEGLVEEKAKSFEKLKWMAVTVSEKGRQWLANAQKAYVKYAPPAVVTLGFDPLNPHQLPLFRECGEVSLMLEVRRSGDEAHDSLAQVIGALTHQRTPTVGSTSVAGQTTQARDNHIAGNTVSVPTTMRDDGLNFTPQERELFDTLSYQCKLIATRLNLMKHNVLDRHSLIDLTRKRPTSLDGFRDVDGVGRKKCDDFGQQFIDILKMECAKLRLATDVGYDGQSDADTGVDQPDRIVMLDNVTTTTTTTMKNHSSANVSPTNNHNTHVIIPLTRATTMSRPDHTQRTLARTVTMLFDSMNNNNSNNSSKTPPNNISPMSAITSVGSNDCHLLPAVPAATTQTNTATTSDVMTTTPGDACVTTDHNAVPVVEQSSDSNTATAAPPISLSVEVVELVVVSLHDTPTPTVFSSTTEPIVAVDGDALLQCVAQCSAKGRGILNAIMKGQSIPQYAQRMMMRKPDVFTALFLTLDCIPVSFGRHHPIHLILHTHCSKDTSVCSTVIDHVMGGVCLAEGVSVKDDSIAEGVNALVQHIRTRHSGDVNALFSALDVNQVRKYVDPVVNTDQLTLGVYMVKTMCIWNMTMYNKQ